MRRPREFAVVNPTARGERHAGSIRGPGTSVQPIGPTSHGLRGANAYTMFLAKVEGMAGTYGGYDGPCPPVNDERVHHYTIRIVALDVKTLGLAGAFDGEAVEKAMIGHVLASGESVATYALNPALVGKTGAN